MLRVGLSGGIGSGKSTVARRFAEHGAVVIDSDELAREVVAPGSAGLAALTEHFGPDILDSEGGLDRGAMAHRVFGDEQARAELNSVVHPRIGARTAELISLVAPDAIVVHDIPLLVESGHGAAYHLVVIVDVPVEERVRRLVERGLDEADARVRISAQATDDQRRAAADVWLDNGGSRDKTLAEVDNLWSERLVPFEANVRLRRRAPKRAPALTEYNPEWPREADRLMARISAVAGKTGLRVDHIGSTSVPGLAAKDIIDLQLTVRSMADADALAEPLGEAGFPVVAEIEGDTVHPVAPDPREWEKRCHTAADPGRYANLHVRAAGTAAWRYALLFRDWLRADAQAREDYLRMKRDVAERHATDADHDAYAVSKEPWFAEALPKAERWAARTGWVPPAAA